MNGPNSIFLQNDANDTTICKHRNQAERADFLVVDLVYDVYEQSIFAIAQAHTAKWQMLLNLKIV